MTIALNAPESMNAFSAEMHYSLSRIWEDVQDDPEANVVVLTGAGRAFSAGGNVIAMQEKIDRPELWVCQRQSGSFSACWNVTSQS